MAKANEATDTKVTEKTPSKGAKVSLIHCNGTHVPAKVTDVLDDGTTINLKTEGKAGFEITSSPFDPTGKKADHWTWPVAETKAEAKAE